MLQGSPKSNVLPQSARVTVNFRIRPGDTTSSVVETATTEAPELPEGLQDFFDQFQNGPGGPSGPRLFGATAVTLSLRDGRIERSRARVTA